MSQEQRMPWAEIQPMVALECVAFFSTTLLFPLSYKGGKKEKAGQKTSRSCREILIRFGVHEKKKFLGQSFRFLVVGKERGSSHLSETALDHYCNLAANASSHGMIT